MRFFFKLPLLHLTLKSAGETDAGLTDVLIWSETAKTLPLPTSDLYVRCTLPSGPKVQVLLSIWYH